AGEIPDSRGPLSFANDGDSSVKVNVERLGLAVDFNGPAWAETVAVPQYQSRCRGGELSE
ncbi:MAG: hypothetical protein ACK48U_21350, partial [Planctomyces sp.]